MPWLLLQLGPCLSWQVFFQDFLGLTSWEAIQLISFWQQIVSFFWRLRCFSLLWCTSGAKVHSDFLKRNTKASMQSEDCLVTCPVSHFTLSLDRWVKLKRVAPFKNYRIPFRIILSTRRDSCFVLINICSDLQYHYNFHLLHPRSSSLPYICAESGHYFTVHLQKNCSNNKTTI